MAYTLHILTSLASPVFPLHVEVQFLNKDFELDSRIDGKLHVMVKHLALEDPLVQMVVRLGGKLEDSNEFVLNLDSCDRVDMAQVLLEVCMRLLLTAKQAVSNGEEEKPDLEGMDGMVGK